MNIFSVKDSNVLSVSIPLSRRRQWQPTPVLLHGKSRGWRSIVGYSPRGHKKSDTTERLHFTWLHFTSLDFTSGFALQSPKWQMARSLPPLLILQFLICKVRKIRGSTSWVISLKWNNTWTVLRTMSKTVNKHLINSSICWLKVPVYFSDNVQR